MLVVAIGRCFFLSLSLFHLKFFDSLLELPDFVSFQYVFLDFIAKTTTCTGKRVGGDFVKRARKENGVCAVKLGNLDYALVVRGRTHIA